MSLAVLAAVGDITVNLWIQYPALLSKGTVALQERQASLGSPDMEI